MKKIITCSFFFAFLLVVACSKKNDNSTPLPTIDAKTVSLHYDQRHQYAVINIHSLTWTSSDTTVGVISKAGLFIAKKIGVTTIQGITGDISVQSIATVIPYSTMCVEPYLMADATISKIKTKESRILSSSTATELVYKGENSKVRYVKYSFDEQGLLSAALALSADKAVMDEALIFVKERYSLSKVEGGFIYYYNKGDNFLIGLGTDPELGGFGIVYLRKRN